MGHHKSVSLEGLFSTYYIRAELEFGHPTCVTEMGNLIRAFGFYSFSVAPMNVAKKEAMVRDWVLEPY